MKKKRIITTVLAGLLALNLFTFGRVGASASTSEAVAFTDDFNDGALGKEWLSCGTGETDGEPKITADGRLDLTAAGSSAVYKQKAERLDSRTETTYTLEATVDVADTGIGVAVGFEIGKPSADAPFGVFFGVLRTVEGYQFVKLGDQSSEYGEKIFVENEEELTFRFQLVLYYHNWVELFVNGEKKQSFYSERSAGHFALASKNAFDLDSVVGGYMDDFVFKTNDYEESFAFNHATNFNGTKPSGGGRTFFIDPKEWYTDGVAVKADELDTSNGKLGFNATETTVQFGPNDRYADYLVKFDLTMGGGTYTEENNGETFGLCVGKRMKSLGTETATGLGITRKDGKSALYAFDQDESDTAELNAQDGETLEFWSAEEQTYQFIYLVQNGKIKMYFKTATDDESVLGILRGEYEVENTYGYFSVFGANGADFEIDNFSVVNLSHGTSTLEYLEGERLENLHMIFSEEASLKAYELTDAKTYEGILHISENGKLETKGDVLNYILRISVNNAGKSFTVGHGDRKIVFNANGRTLKLVGYAETEQTVVLDRRLYLDGAVLEIACIGEALSVSYANNTDPFARMENVIEIAVPMLKERAKISVTSTEGTSALTALSVFNFDMNGTIKTRDYDTLKDEVSPWVERPTGAEQAQENSLKKNFGYILLAGCTAVAVVIFFIDWRQKNKKEEDK